MADIDREAVGLSISDKLREERKRLDADRALHQQDVAEHQAKVEDFAKESAVWRSRAEHQDEREKALHARHAELDRRAATLDERDSALKASKDDVTLLALLQRAADVEKRATEQSNREGDLFTRERNLALREEDYRIRMSRLKQIVEEYFRAPSK